MAIMLCALIGLNLALSYVGRVHPLLVAGLALGEIAAVIAAAILAG